MVRIPSLWKKHAGTVVITAVGMFGKGCGWAIPPALRTLCVTLGDIAERPGVVEGRLEPRERLSVTLSFDHDIVDGAPAARFASRFKELLEDARGLDELACGDGGRGATP